MRLTGCRVRAAHTAVANGVLSTFLALEELEVVGCHWEAHSDLPANLRRLIVEDGQVRANSRLDWAHSGLPYLEHLSIRGVEALDMAFLHQLLVVQAAVTASTAGLRGLEVIWTAFQNQAYNQNFPIQSLQAILQTHGSTPEELTIGCRGLPPAAVDVIRLNCPALLRLSLCARNIGWFAIRTIIRHVQNTGWGLRRLEVIHWDDTYNAAAARTLIAALDQLGIEHNIERSAAPR